MLARNSATSRVSQISRHISSSSQTYRTAHTGTVFKLNTGATIPAIGFGTWQDADAQASAVKTAVKAGYRHIDTARIYSTEAGVSKGIKASGVPREDIFITTKLWNNSHHPDDVEPALDASLKDLETDYVDLYLMHWPSPFVRSDKLMPKDEAGKIKSGKGQGYDYVDTYKAMEKVFQKGKARAIGVSNFSKAEMERLVSEVNVLPAVHQLELHGYLAQKDFADWHTQHNIHVTQYSPFGNQNEIYSSGKNHQKLIEDPVLVDIGKKYGKSGAQVALAWGIAHGRTVIPKSKTPSRIESNLQGDFELEPADVQRIDSLDKKLRFNDPSKSFGWNFYADLDGKR